MSDVPVVPPWVAEVINRRAAVEQELFNMAKAGESASPEKLREIALRLGTPRVIEQREMILPPDGVRWRTDDTGLGIWDEDFTFDAALSVHGDFGTEESKKAYVAEVVALLNAASSAP